MRWAWGVGRARRDVLCQTKLFHRHRARAARLLREAPLSHTHTHTPAGRMAPASRPRMATTAARRQTAAAPGQSLRELGEIGGRCGARARALRSRRAVQPQKRQHAPDPKEGCCPNILCVLCCCVSPCSLSTAVSDLLLHARARCVCSALARAVLAPYAAAHYLAYNNVGVRGGVALLIACKKGRLNAFVCAKPWSQMFCCFRRRTIKRRIALLDRCSGMNTNTLKDRASTTCPLLLRAT